MSVLVALVAGAAVTRANDLPPAKIGPVTIGQNQSEVEAAMGAPLRRVSTGDALDPELQYEGLSIWLGDGGPVAEIRSSSSQHCTPDDICPGMKLKAAETRLASRSLGESTYKVDAETCWLKIESEGDVIGALYIKCQP
jgi:hypothetical protein